MVGPSKQASIHTHVRNEVTLVCGSLRLAPTKIFTETFLATDETKKYTDVRVILPQLSGGTAAVTENRRDKVHTLQLKGYRKFDFMLLHAHAALSGECSYYVDTTWYHHVHYLAIWLDFAFECFESLWSGSIFHSNASKPFRMIRICIRML